VAEAFVKGRFPSVGKVVVATNIIFYHKVNGQIIRECPDDVFHITTMKELFPIIVDSVKKYGRQVRILLILDEAQNFIAGDNNSINESVNMKIFLGTIRKYRLMVWFLTPTAMSVGPAFRNYTNDPNKAGNVTCKLRKDIAQNKIYIRKKKLDWDPNQVVIVHSNDRETFFMRVGKTEWTKSHEELNEGEYCYDHESNATFYAGEGFDFDDFNRVMGDVASVDQMDAIVRYYKKMDGPAEEEKEDDENTQFLRAVAMLKMSSKKSWTAIAEELGMPRKTLMYRLRKAGLTTVDSSGNAVVNEEMLFCQQKDTARQAGRQTETAPKIPPIYISKTPDAKDTVEAVSFADGEYGNDDGKDTEETL